MLMLAKIQRSLIPTDAVSTKNGAYFWRAKAFKEKSYRENLERVVLCRLWAYGPVNSDAELTIDEVVQPTQEVLEGEDRMLRKLGPAVFF